jgi:iron complex transport system permease protein
MGTAAACLLVGLGPRWDFFLLLRATRLAGMAVIGVAIAVETFLFRTISRNCIPTAQIMGFDALFILMQTLTRLHDQGKSIVMVLHEVNYTAA